MFKEVTKGMVVLFTRPATEQLVEETAPAIVYEAHRLDDGTYVCDLWVFTKFAGLMFVTGIKYVASKGSTPGDTFWMYTEE